MAFSGVFLAVFLVTGVMAHYTSPDICKALSPKVCDNAGQVLIERPCETETHDIMIQHWPTNCFIANHIEPICRYCITNTTEDFEEAMNIADTDSVLVDKCQITCQDEEKAESCDCK